MTVIIKGRKWRSIGSYFQHYETSLWYIKTFELFSRQYSEIAEDEFVQLEFSSEDALRKRKDNYET